LNTAEVAELVQQNDVVTIKADKTRTSPEIDKLLVELGNSGRGIPFYAVFPGRGGAPITFDGLITQQQVLDALRRAGPSVAAEQTAWASP
jgi:thiol:disulfide interchange protein DsbD